jgi:glycosyltransferase involved in cell wall biosynthesis
MPRAVTSPRVSVICIFLDEERFLREAVDSVLAQDFADWQLLLVDDGSRDASTAIARDYAAAMPGKVRYLEHSDHANRGMSATRNLGLAHAHGEFVVFMDADDRWRPARLGEQVAILDAHPEAGMVCGTANYWQSWAGGEDRLVPTGHLVDAVSAPPGTSLALYPLGAADAPCDLMIRSALVERVGGCEEAFRGLYEDIAFHAKLYLEAGLYLSPKTWFDYRLHPDSCCAAASPEALRAARLRFLEWFARYLAARGRPEERAVLRAVRRERFRLRHPVAARAASWAGRLARSQAIAR